MVTKTVAVLGGSFGGSRAAQVLAQQLPRDWRVVLVDRNSHFNYLYVLPRYVVAPGHEHKAFIPYTNILDPSPNSRHLFLHAQVKSLRPNSVTLSRAFPEYGIDGPEPTLHFDYAIYALGSHLPSPINIWGPIGDEPEGAVVDVEADGKESLKDVQTESDSPPLCKPVTPTFLPPGMKTSGIQWLQRYHTCLENASSVLVVGGGALGIQYATDIAEVFPTKPVTLLHSRAQLLPRFDQGMHDEIVSALSEMNVTTILGDRLDLSYPGKIVCNKNGIEERIVRTQSGREVRAGIVLLCTGQVPNTSIMQELLPDSVISEGPSKGMIHVKRTMQVAIPAPVNKEDTVEDALNKLSIANDHVEDASEEVDGDDPEFVVPYPNLFAVGDAADAFGAINAGHNAYFQGAVAANNVLKLIKLQQRQAQEITAATTSSSRLSSDDVDVVVNDTEDTEENTSGPTSEEEEDLTLDRYIPGPPAIKISLGLTKALFQINGVVGKKSDMSEDLDAPATWKFLGADVEGDAMYH